jgi:hypothetical protein
MSVVGSASAARFDIIAVPPEYFGHTQPAQSVTTWVWSPGGVMNVQI